VDVLAPYLALVLLVIFCCSQLSKFAILCQLVMLPLKFNIALLVNGAHQLVMCCRSVATWWT